MSYIHFITSERAKIETSAVLNYSIREIAHKLGRNPSTVSRELKRFVSAGPYQVESTKKTCTGKMTDWTAASMEKAVYKLPANFQKNAYSRPPSTVAWNSGVTRRLKLT